MFELSFIGLWILLCVGIFVFGIHLFKTHGHSKFSNVIISSLMMVVWFQLPVLIWFMNERYQGGPHEVDSLPEKFIIYQIKEDLTENVVLIWIGKGDNFEEDRLYSIPRDQLPMQKFRKQNNSKEGFQDIIVLSKKQRSGAGGGNILYDINFMATVKTQDEIPEKEGQR